MPNKVLKAAFYIYFTLLFYTTLSPISASNSSILQSFKIPHIDKWVHFIAFIGLILSFRLAFKDKSLFFGLLFSVIVGVLIEFLQELMGFGRSADIYDVLADFLGIFTGYCLIKLFKI